MISFSTAIADCAGEEIKATSNSTFPRQALKNEESGIPRPLSATITTRASECTPSDSESIVCAKSSGKSDPKTKTQSPAAPCLNLNKFATSSEIKSVGFKIPQGYAD